MNSERRKIILIDRRFQIKLILKFLLVNLLIISIFSFLLYLFFDSEIEANLKSAHVNYENIRQMLLPIVSVLGILNILISSIIITVFVLFASHHIAGPMYRFHAILDKLKKRDLTAIISLRSGDQMNEFSNQLKNLVKIFSSDIAEIKKATSAIDRALDENIGENEIKKQNSIIRKKTELYKI